MSQPGLAFTKAGLAVHGDIAVVGVPRESSSGAEAGAVYVFRRGGNNRFDFVEKLMASDAAAYQNWRIGFYPRWTDSCWRAGTSGGTERLCPFQGGAYVFEYDGSGWSER